MLLLPFQIDFLFFWRCLFVVQFNDIVNSFRVDQMKSLWLRIVPDSASSLSLTMKNNYILKDSNLHCHALRVRRQEPQIEWNI